MTKVTTKPEPGSPIDVHEVRRSLSGRRLVVFGIVCVVLVGCGIGTFLYLGQNLHTTNTREPITVTDANKIVTIDLSAGWENTTAKDAGRISTEGDSGDSIPPYRVPDISAYRDFADAEEASGSWLDVTFEIPALGTSDREQHVAQVQKVIED